MTNESVPVWKYDEYDQWSRALAKSYSKNEIEKRYWKLCGKKNRLAQSHRQAIEKTCSMQGNSWNRAQSRNAMVGNYEEIMACENALEIYEYYPEHTKDGIEASS